MGDEAERAALERERAEPFREGEGLSGRDARGAAWVADGFQAITNRIIDIDQRLDELGGDEVGRDGA